MQHFTPSASINAKDMRSAMSLVGSIISQRNTIPILGTCRFDVEPDGITITSTDLDNEIRMTIEANVFAAPFGFTLSPRRFNDILRWASGDVSFALEKDVLRIKADDLTCGYRSLQPVEDYPVMVWNEDRAKLVATISEAKLRKCLALAYSTVSTEETRYYLNGIFFTPIPHKGLRMVSTDGHRMTIYDTGEAWGGEAAIVPSAAVRLLMRHLVPNGNREVRIAQQDYRLEFATDDCRIRVKCIDGTFPDYTRVIPSESGEIEVTLTAAALNRFPSRPSTRYGGGRAIQINPDGGEMTYRAPDDFEFSMPCTGHGPAFGMNLDYLKAFARLSGTIQLRGKAPGDPFRVVSDDPDLLQIQMPMRV